MYRMFILIIAVFAAMVILPGCSCESQQTQTAEQLFRGFNNPEDLVRVYLKAVKEKDIELLKTVLIEESDLKLLKLKNVSKQHIMTYNTHNKRLFLNTNKDLLGKPLTFKTFRPGTELRVNQDVSIYRGAQILAELKVEPEQPGKRVALEIPLMVKIKGYWKILFLRYPHPKANIGQGPKVEAAKTDKDPAVKLPATLPKMELKVKKVEDGKDEKPAPEDEALKDLEKLFK